MSTLLETVGLTKQFGEFTAIDDVDFNIEDNSIASIIGPNGAGKTTFFSLITGQHKPTKGQIIYKDGDITGKKPYQRVNEGIARVFQISNIFPDLTTFENIRLAVQSKYVNSSGILSRAKNNEEVITRTNELIENIDLNDQRDLEAKNLAHGNKRRLEIGMALGLEPELLIMDEPTAGLPATEVSEIKQLVEDISVNITILIVEHKMDFVMDLSDEISVLHQGELVAKGTSNEIRADDRVREIYIGEGSYA